MSAGAGHVRAPLEQLRGAVRTAAATVRGADGELRCPAAPERPKREGQGDYSTNAAMLLAPVLDAPPRVIAERLGTALSELLGDQLERAEVAGPGFLNLVLSDAWLTAKRCARCSRPATRSAAAPRTPPSGF